jgi:hypothetical protein
MRPASFAVLFASASASAAAALLFSPPARADDPSPAPDPAFAIALGGATLFAGFVAGGTIIASSGDPGAREAGWLGLESSFALAPFAAHAAVGEWARGALFASVPAATTLSTIPVFLEQPDAVDHGSLEEQRVMWGLFVGGLGVAVAGVLDAAFAPGRAVHVTPVLAGSTTGLLVGGSL